MEGLAIGRFRITRKIGAGGMAEVYEAKHELMDRYAAVKLLRPEMSAREIIVQRFFQEAQAAASIEHPGIVHVYDVGYTVDGRAYLVMELLPGETLSQRLQRHKRLPLEATVTMIRQLAGVIGAAHQRGIVHRDLKPDNIFLVPDPEMPNGERVKVLDFGLAKLLEVPFPHAELTAQGAVFGTPAYMAPEQCRSSGNVDQRADLYAIGCIFYMCLCDHAPFGTGGIEVLLAQMTQTPVPPRQHAPDIPPAIDELILQLLAKDPDRRLPSCETFIAQLDRVVETLPEAFSRGGRSHANDELTMRDNPTLQGTHAFAVKHVPNAGASADRTPALPGPGRVHDSPERPRLAPGVRPAEPTQHLTTQALMPLDIDEDTDRISVPARHGIAGPMSKTTLTRVDDAEQLSDDAVELIDDEQVEASDREIRRLKAQDTVHLQPTARLAARSPVSVKETLPMHPRDGVDMGATPPLTAGLRKGIARTGRALPGVPEPADQQPRPLPGVPGRSDETTHALPDVPGPSSGPSPDIKHAAPGVRAPTDEAKDAAPAARGSAAGAIKRTPAQAMQLTALPWQPDAPNGPEGGVQQPGEAADQGDKAGRASTPTLSSGELEPRPRPRPRPRTAPRRTADRRVVWAVVGLAGLGVLLVAGVLVAKSGDEASRPQPAKPVVESPAEEPPAENAQEAARQEKIDDLLHQVEQEIAAKDWDGARDRLADAHELEPVEGQRLRLDDLDGRLSTERQSQEALADLRAAAKKQRIDAVFAELGKIPEGSVYQAEARAAALEAARTRVERLVHRGDCKALASVVETAARALPEARDELQAQKVACVKAAAVEAPAPGTSGKRDPRQILNDAREAYKGNRFRTASLYCSELRNLGQVNDEAAMLCALVACKRQDRLSAKWFYGRPVRASVRTQIATSCRQEAYFDVKK
jgi:serine/threonine protein kinase